MKKIIFGLVALTLLIAFPVQGVFAVNPIPVITLIGSSTINHSINETYIEQGAVCTDDPDGVLPVTIGGDVVDTSTAGTFVVTYDCQDSVPHSAVQVTRTVIVSLVPDVELFHVDIFCPTGSAIGLTEMIPFLQICPILGADPPVITIIGNSIVELVVDEIYVELGATAFDNEDGDVTSSIITTGTVVTQTTGINFIRYNVDDSVGNSAIEKIRTVIVSSAPSITGVSAGGGGAPVSGTVDTGIEGFTPEQIQAFDEAVANAIASIDPTERNVVEQIIQTFFEFAVVDKLHEEVILQSFLDNERLGIRWSTGQDIVIVSVTPASSPFMFTFEQFPVIKRGSDAFVSTNFLVYNLEIPRNECTNVITTNCTEKIRYEIPVTVNAVIEGIQVSDTGTITVDLTEDRIDPVLLIILSTLSIPFIAVIIQRTRGRPTQIPLRKLIS